MKINQIKNFFLDLFFPKKCLGCGKSDTYLCSDCFSRLSMRQDQIINNTCFFCGKISWQGKICTEHKPEVYLDRIISTAEYKNPLIREIIKTLKYRYVQELSVPLSQLLIKTLQNNWSLGIDHWGFIVVPIPLHKFRLRKRGFNQAELLAKPIADYFNLSIRTDILERITPTDPQANIKNTDKRKSNLKDIFNINAENAKTIEGTNIILIDDVCTTGATLIEAARVLKLNGAREIWGLTVAKG